MFIVLSTHIREQLNHNATLNYCHHNCTQIRTVACHTIEVLVSCFKLRICYVIFCEDKWIAVVEQCWEFIEEMFKCHTSLNAKRHYIP